MSNGDPEREAAALEVVGEAARVLALLAAERGAGLSLPELSARGVSTPAHAIYMLQLAGYDVVRTSGAIQLNAIRPHADAPRAAATPHSNFAAIDRAFGIALVFATILLLAVVLS